MKFDTELLLQPVKNMDGESIPEKPGKNDPLTVKKAIRLALTSSDPNEKESTDERYRLYELAMRINNVKEKSVIDISAEEIALIKKKCIILSTEVLGFIYNALEGKMNV